MMLINQVADKLAAVSVDNPRLEAMVIIERISGLDRSVVISENIRLNHWQLLRLNKLIKKRRKLPLAYLLHSKEFYGREFYINRNVLIPRPESEDIVDMALKLDCSGNVFDVGCGSGCLGISYALNRQSTRLVFIDINKKALDVARHNANKYGVKGRFVIKDIRQTNSHQLFLDGGIVLANLPYLPINKQLAYERRCPDLKTEPRSALYADDGGLELYKRLFEACNSSNVVILTESLINQHMSLQNIAKTNGFQLLETRGLIQRFGR